MNSSAELSHTVTTRIMVSAASAFAFLCDPYALGAWSLGCMNTRPDPAAEGIFAGRSLFDGSETRFAIAAHPGPLTVDYLLGADGQMVPSISIRVVPGKVCGLGDDRCTVTMTAWKHKDMSVARWDQLCASHEAEIHLIRTQCEHVAAGCRAGSVRPEIG